MNCKAIQKQILSYLDGEFHQDLANDFEKHLKVCNSCNLEVERLREAYNLIDIEKSEYKPDPIMSTRILAKLNKKNISTSTNKYSIRYLTIVSLAAAGIAIGIIIGSLYSSTTLMPENITSIQEWDQLADEYMPEVESNPYNMVTNTNETPTKP